ncbi:MAG: zinc ribbon domain-containing protein [Actinomycetota bacterium]|nr:zinc ribbon domain-containing protein [Actinomycetota bacterium]
MDDDEQRPQPEEQDDTTDGENKRPDDTLAQDKTCPECGAPVDDVRASCMNCGYEYKDEDHENMEAGNEFMSGSQIDEGGNELPDEEPPATAPADEDTEDTEE